jgi:hypothetical protein
MKKYKLFIALFGLLTGFCFNTRAQFCPDDIELIAPVVANAFVLDKANPEATLTFEWTDAGASYELVISKNQDLSDPLIAVPNITTASRNITHAELQALINNPENQLKRYLDNPLYWGIKIGGNVAATHSLALAGMRTFTDVRGEESITYDVSVITYLDETKGIWLSSDLRAKRYNDGNRMGEWAGENREIETPGEGPYAAEIICMDSPVQQGGTRTAFSGDPVPQANLDNVGVYYNQGKTEAYTKVAPIGWKVASRADFNKLYDAAAVAEGGFVVLKNPACYPGNSGDDNWAHYNDWNMNMAANGRFYWTFWGWAYTPGSWFYNMDQTGESDMRGSCVWGGGTADDRSWPDDTTGAPVRVIYTGDGL